MAPIFRIAVIQLYVKPLRPAENFAKAVKFIRDAAAQECNLAVLPECHLTNCPMDDPRFVPLCTDWETYLHKYQALAKECNICIVPGSIVQTIPDTAPHSDRPKLENVTYFISNTGQILGSYTKKNLWGPMESKLIRSSGNAPHRVIQTPLGPVGLLLCWDLAFPEACRELVYQGAKIIIMPIFLTRHHLSDAGHRWNPSGICAFVDNILAARACENTCAMVCANAGGPSQHYFGHSQITLPYVGPMARLGTSTEGIMVADLDMAILDDAEANINVRADLTREDWHYSYSRRDGQIQPGAKL
ncbi:carbon-nitrogen hydrolase family protein [Aspergillus tanneri]|uniref:CN hydrolase domain-containing protein n=1 Tax=Aspergillus tanneri TaxID=1220188 RepID=A0A5M9MBJ1_9EURO|nr:uncharacterized protein ATNIH1004_009552 [Aspergillus tanneri]KAA8642800.1 hypothetical protein ATNIH1004_009552 [Aspergillus tanneri]